MVEMDEPRLEADRKLALFYQKLPDEAIFTSATFQTITVQKMQGERTCTSSNPIVQLLQEHKVGHEVADFMMYTEYQH